MIMMDNDNREENIDLRKESREAQYTVRLHFAQENKDNHIAEEIQKLLTETYIRNFIPKGGEWFE